MAFFTRVVGRHHHQNANDDDQERAADAASLAIAAADHDPLLLERGGASGSSSSRPSSPAPTTGNRRASGASSTRRPRRPLPLNPFQAAWSVLKAGAYHLALLPTAADALGGSSPAMATTLLGVVLSSPQVCVCRLRAGYLQIAGRLA